MSSRHRSPSLVPGLLATAACLACAPMAHAQASSSPPNTDTVPTTPTQVQAVMETVKLPGGERMGWMGAQLMAETLPGLRLGLGTYGAVRGERGGFITIGAGAEAHRKLSDRWRGNLGLFVGAGGGRGGYTLSGGGLMVRADAGLTYETNGWGNYGFGVSHVRFPAAGSIASTQPYVRFEYPFHTMIRPGWGESDYRSSWSAKSLATSPQEFSVTMRHYRIPSHVVQDNKVTPQYPRMELVGAEWLSYVDDRWFVKVEAEGAMGGQSVGYMQVFYGGGYRLPLGNMAALKLHAAAGPAGGGAVDTGGGLLLDAGLGLQLNLTRDFGVEASVGQVRAPSRSFTSTSVGLKLVHRFGTPKVEGQSVSTGSLAGWEQNALRVRLSQQVYSKASNTWRSHHADERVGNLGLQLDYFGSPYVYLTGQAHAADTGNAGAYMNGLVGGGARVPLWGKLYAGGEALIGAAGGGGLQITGGLVRQINALVGYQITPSVSVEAMGGQFAGIRGPFKANVVGVQLGYQFTGFTAR